MPSPESLTLTERRERAHLVRDLKTYAFSLSRPFHDSRINRIDTGKTFYLPDPEAEPIRGPDGEIIEPDDEGTEAKLILGFNAFRLMTDEDDYKLGYDFTIRATLQQNTDAAPPELLPYIDDENIEHLGNADVSDILVTQTTTYEVSQLGDEFMAVTTERGLVLYGETLCELSTAMLHRDRQPAKGTEVPYIESFDGDSHQLSPRRVDHPQESVIDSLDTCNDAVIKLERELAFRAIFAANDLDLARALMTTSDAAKSIRHIVHSLRTGDPGVL